MPESISSTVDIKVAFWLLKARECFLGWVESLPLSHEVDHSEYLQKMLEKMMKEKACDMKLPFMENLAGTLRHHVQKRLTAQDAFEAISLLSRGHITREMMRTSYRDSKQSRTEAINLYLSKKLSLSKSTIEYLGGCALFSQL